jgi:hypothetical protein
MFGRRKTSLSLAIISNMGFKGLWLLSRNFSLATAWRAYPSRWWGKMWVI